MAKKVEKRGPGRPSITDYMVLVRLQEEDVRRVDAWIVRRRRETGAKLGRGQAVRTLMREGLDRGKVLMSMGLDDRIKKAAP